MCGIAGWAGPGIAAGDEVMAALLGALAHRGPDAEGWRAGAGWAVGARRLAIIDLETGDQPIANEAGDVHAVLNGEIYNYRELRQRLLAAGHRCARTATPRCSRTCRRTRARRCSRGCAACSRSPSWTKRQRRLFLARDRVGKKPLYWLRRGTTVAFASEPKALRAAFAAGPGSTARRSPPT